MTTTMVGYHQYHPMETPYESSIASTAHLSGFSSHVLGIPPSDPFLDDASDFEYDPYDDDCFSDAGSETSLDSCSMRCNPHDRPLDPFPSPTEETTNNPIEMPDTQSAAGLPTIPAEAGLDSPPRHRIFVTEHEREYHAYRAGKYVFPEDMKEKDRGDLAHMMYTQLLEGELHTAPLDDPKRILDLGPGSGSWAIDMAMRYPAATVYTMDLSGFPANSPPPNITPIIHDFDLDWPFPTNYFDFIHCREIYGGTDSYQNLIKKIYKHLTPGGYVEITEMPPRVQSKRPEAVPSDFPLLRHIKLLNKALKVVGRDPEVIDHLHSYVHEANYIDITPTKTIAPLCTWAREARWKDVGRLNMLNFLEGLEGWSLAPCTRGLGMDANSVKRKTKRCNKGIMDRRMNMFCEIMRVVGRKPVVGESITEEKRALPSPAVIYPV
ncbi:S-adenosyl-L-methionine-dependent methyltransferase [Ascobolus immersus RN42]|uniref:S-adenosyl-L-methionine-dependent methyltransferase n=1 Tax=Ascobolus immersus RN42 TaxID=1160509 RepID=A0A3N4IUW6_ASCIM|nr:S-adenosyl-L-methionine-dependent methyltransferase [Ascobolus immersus RN42]